MARAPEAAVWDPCTGEWDAAWEVLAKIAAVAAAATTAVDGQHT